MKLNKKIWKKNLFLDYFSYFYLRIVLWWRKKEKESHTKVKNKICIFCGKIHEIGTKAVCEANILSEYWDDYLHIQ